MREEQSDAYTMERSGTGYLMAVSGEREDWGQRWIMSLSNGANGMASAG